MSTQIIDSKCLVKTNHSMLHDVEANYENIFYSS